MLLESLRCMEIVEVSEIGDWNQKRKVNNDTLKILTGQAMYV